MGGRTSCLETLPTASMKVSTRFVRVVASSFAPIRAREMETKTTLSHCNRKLRPTLSQYLFVPYLVYTLNTTDDTLESCRLDTYDRGWSSPKVRMNDDVDAGLNQWTRSYLPADVEISYDRPQDVLIKPPTRVVVSTPESAASASAPGRPPRGNWRIDASGVFLAAGRSGEKSSKLPCLLRGLGAVGSLPLRIRVRDRMLCQSDIMVSGAGPIMRHLLRPNAQL